MSPSLLMLFARRQGWPPATPILAAPDVRLLRHLGGPMSIDDFRSSTAIFKINIQLLTNTLRPFNASYIAEHTDAHRAAAAAAARAAEKTRSENLLREAAEAALKIRSLTPGTSNSRTRISQYFSTVESPLVPKRQATLNGFTTSSVPAAKRIRVEEQGKEGGGGGGTDNGT